MLSYQLKKEIKQTSKMCNVMLLLMAHIYELISVHDVVFF